MFRNLAHYARKNAQVVTNLQQICSNAVPTTCQQNVFALLVPSSLTSCQLSTYYTVVELNRLVTSYNTFCLWKHHVNLLLQSFRSVRNIYVVFPQTKSIIRFIAMQTSKKLVASCSNNLLSSCNSTSCE